MTNKEKVQQFKQITAQMAELYEKKNKNYGDSFSELFKKLGPVSALVPLWNKLDRATNLIKGGHNDFESLQDTLIDLANYAIMAYIEFSDKSAAPQSPIKEEELNKWACDVLNDNDGSEKKTASPSNDLLK